RIKPVITDVHSGHRVDPLDFDDPIAQQAKWGTIADSTANFKTRQLVRNSGKLSFKVTGFAAAFGLLFPAVGLFTLVLSIYQFITNEIATVFRPKRAASSRIRELYQQLRSTNRSIIAFWFDAPSLKLLKRVLSSIRASSDKRTTPEMSPDSSAT
ncbi:MAG: hypothetical protein VB949_15670, partial [Pseudomonadales bacterium]